MNLPADFQAARAAEFALMVEAARAHLARPADVGSGPMGLTPDAVRATPAYQAWKARSDAAAAAQRAFGTAYNARFKSELRAMRRLPGSMGVEVARIRAAKVEAARLEGVAA